MNQPVNAVIHVSPSGLERAWNCTGFPFLAEGLPKDAPGPAAVLGTFKHMVVLGAVAKQDPGEVYNLAEAGDCTYEQVQLMEAHAKTLLQLFSETTIKGGTPQVEQKLLELEELGMVPTGRPGEFQADLYWSGKETWHVLDYKSGSTPVEVKDNKQLMAYAWAVMKREGLLNSNEKVMLWVYQPELKDWPTGHAVTMEEIRQFGKACAAKTIEMETGGQLAEGPWCTWCPVDKAGACSLMQQKRGKRRDVKEAVKTQAAEIGHHMAAYTGMDLSNLAYLPKAASDITIPAEVVSKVDEALAFEAELLAVDKGNADAASEHLKLVGTLESKLEDVEMLAKKPYADAKKAVEDAFRDMRTRLKDAKKSLKDKIASHLAIEERKRQAEIQRQKDEQDRINKELAEKEAAAKKLKGEAARKAEAEAQELRNQAATASVVNIPAPTKVAGVATKKAWTFDIPEVGKIPDRYLVKHEGALSCSTTTTVAIVEVDFALMAKDASAGRLEKATWVSCTLRNAVSAR